MCQSYSYSGLLRYLFFFTSVKVSTTVFNTVFVCVGEVFTYVLMGSVFYALIGEARGSVAPLRIMRKPSSALV